MKVVLFAPNTREDIDKFCTWPADMLITDYPELGPCPGCCRTSRLPARVRTAASISLAAWLSVLMLGRLVGYF